VAPDDLRDDRALARFDLFLFTAVATVLVIRAALAITGYPQVGGGGLHVAHVLWGGLLMGVAIVIVQILPGSRPRIRAAFIGGIGFGLFIDEIGKFLTKDVDYFFKPAVAIIYAVFIVAYLVVREVVDRRPLTDARRLALAATAVTDLALGELGEADRRRALRLLDGVDATASLAKSAAGVREALSAPAKDPHGVEAWITGWFDRIENAFDQRISDRSERLLLIGVCVLQAAITALSVVLSLIRPGSASGLTTALDTDLPAALSAALIIAAFVLVLRDDNKRAMTVLEWAIAVDLLFVQVVVFNRVQWLGLIGFAAAALALGALRFVQRAVGVDAGAT
jgi:hypothetical protein